MVWGSVIFGGLSALCWLAASIVIPAWTPPRWGGPNVTEMRRLTWGSKLNAAGALCAAIAMGCQAYSTWAAMPS